MAGANNKALKHAGMTAREVEVFRASGGKSLRSAAATAHQHSPTVQGANADFRAKAAAGLKSMAERKAALQAARQQRVGKSLGAAMQIARGMRQKQRTLAPLPKLSGSDKQVAWASKMRDAAISAAERAAKQDPGLWADTVRVFRLVKSARTWIDHGRSPTDHAYNVRHMAGAEGIQFD